MDERCGNVAEFDDGDLHCTLPTGHGGQHFDMSYPSLAWYDLATDDVTISDVEWLEYEN